MRIWILAVTVVVVLAGVAGGAYWFGGRSADEPVLVLNTAPATSDGIKVHGDWTVTVTNPDGTVDAVHEFENALHVQGALTAVLAGLNTIDKSVIKLITDESATPFNCQEAYGGMVGYTSSSPNRAMRYLEAQFTIEYSQKLPFRLSAICTVTEAETGPGILTSVETHFFDLDQCWTVYWAPNTPQHKCQSTFPDPNTGYYMSPNWGASTAGYAYFTEADNLNVTVSNGQTVGINVEISFD